MLNKMVEEVRNRRKFPDRWVYVVQILTVLSWLLFIAALVISFYAAPDDDYGLWLYKDVDTRDYWLKPLTTYLYVVLWLSALLSFLCLLLTRFRARRKSDNKPFSLILLIITIAAWITYIATHN